MKRSSTVASQRSVPAQLEHGRQDAWTSTHPGEDDKKGSERVTTAGERLKNQRPHPPVKIEDEEDAHEVVTGSGCSGGCDLPAGVPHHDDKAGSIVFHSSSNASVFENDNKEAHVTTFASAKRE